MILKSNFALIPHNKSQVFIKKPETPLYQSILKSFEFDNTKLPSTQAALIMFGAKTVRPDSIFEKTLDEILTENFSLPKVDYDNEKSPYNSERKTININKADIISKIKNKQLKEVFQNSELMSEISESFTEASKNIEKQINELRKNNPLNNEKINEIQVSRLEKIKKIIDKANTSIEELQGKDPDIGSMVAFKGKSANLKKAVIGGLIVLALLGSPINQPNVQASDIWKNYQKILESGYLARQEFLKLWNKMTPREKMLFERIENEESGHYYYNNNYGIPVTQQNFNTLMKRIGANSQDADFVLAWMRFHESQRENFGGDCLSPRKLDIFSNIWAAQNNKIVPINNTNEPYKDTNVLRMMKIVNAKPEELFFVSLCMQWNNKTLFLLDYSLNM